MATVHLLAENQRQISRYYPEIYNIEIKMIETCQKFNQQGDWCKLEVSTVDLYFKKNAYREKSSTHEKKKKR